MKKILAIVTVLFLIFSINISVSAYELLGHELIGGVGNSGNNTRYYWLNDNATNNYTTVINSAMYSWNHTASSPGVRTPIWFEPVASSSYSVMDIYVFSESFALANGSTVFFGTYYDHSSYIDPLESDWRWCQIKVYAGNFNSSTLRSLAEGVTFKSVVAHEMGHVFGLYENPEDNTSIMCQSNSRGINVTGPNADDCRGINAIY